MKPITDEIINLVLEIFNVDKNKFQHTRTSLAFNSYIRGTIGSYKHNYELSLI